MTFNAILLTCKVSQWMVQGEPEDEDGYPRVLDARLNGDGDHVLDGPGGGGWRKGGGATASSASSPPAYPCQGAAKGEPQPGQSHPGGHHSPAHDLEHVEVCPDPEDQDEEDEEEGQRLQDADQEGGHPGQIAGNQEADAQRNDLD